MSDQGEPVKAPPGFLLRELAERFGGEVLGESGVRVRSIRTLERAGDQDLAFLTDSRYREGVAETRAAALLVPPDFVSAAGGDATGGDVGAPTFDGPLWVCDKPALILAAVIPHFQPEPRAEPRIEATARVAEDCEIHPTAHVGHYAVLGSDTTVEAGAVIHPHVVVGRNCRIGANVVLHPHVVLYDGTELGERVVVHAGTVLGADGFRYEIDQGTHVKIPHTGRTVVEADVEIGALSAIDRAMLEETRIGAGSKIDNLVQVGHNVEIGQGCMLCGQSGLAGSARLGNYVVLAGQAGAAGHLKLEDGVQVAAKSAALQSVPAGRQVAGIPAIDLGKWKRQMAFLPRLGELARRVRALEKKLFGERNSET